MTAAERTVYIARFRRTLHDDEVRPGTRQPRSAREFEIWRQAQAERDERQAWRIARAQRRGGPFVSDADAE
jgi:hypothetical protein